MGITFNDARMLWNARQNGVSFTNTLTIGHQNLSLHPSETRWFQNEFKKHFTIGGHLPLSQYKFYDYADEFISKFLLAQQISILDYSSYENATIIHDMNLPIPKHFANQFDAVIDGGSLEHIFNVPMALQNIAKVTKPGGSIFITVPSNNLCGHGLYQFSPELFFRYFSKENGFLIQEVCLFESKFSSIELSKNKVIYRAIDPKIIGNRVGYSNKKPTTIMVHAVKQGTLAGGTILPLQSDYEQLWAGSMPNQTMVAGKKFFKTVYHRLPHFIRCLIFGYHEKWRLNLHNKQLFTRVG